MRFNPEGAFLTLHFLSTVNMNSVTCSTCGSSTPIEQPVCVHCGADVSTAIQTQEAVRKIEDINKELAKSVDRMRELTTPVKTTSINGCGIMLLDYRRIDEDVCEVTRWVT